MRRVVWASDVIVRSFSGICQFSGVSARCVCSRLSGFAPRFCFGCPTMSAPQHTIERDDSSFVRRALRVPPGAVWRTPDVMTPPSPPNRPSSSHPVLPGLSLEALGPASGGLGVTGAPRWIPRETPGASREGVRYILDGNTTSEGHLWERPPNHQNYKTECTYNF